MSQVAQTAEKCVFPTECVPTVDSTVDAQSSRKSKSRLTRIGIDLLGGDLCSSDHLVETLHGLFKEIEEPFHLTVFTTPDSLPHLEAFKLSMALKDEELEFIVTDEVIHMDDDPLLAMRRKKNASLCIGMRLLKKRKLDALLSTGNTGALIASAKLYIPMINGISKAALIALLPTRKDPLAVIDVGANLHCKPDHLLQFAQMGVAFQKSRGIDHPTVGLLNIGREEKKGRAEHRESYKLLQEIPNFVGNVEGKELFSGTIHVLVTDGFTGNVLLKTSEGLSSFILESVQKELYSANYPGALLCGIDGIVMKCHGDATPEALKECFHGALGLIQASFLDKIKFQLQTALSFH